VDLDTNPEVVALVTDDAVLVEGIVAPELPTVEGFSSLYDTQGGTITAIAFGLAVVVVVQLLVARIFSGAKTMVEALTFFATAMVSVLVAVYLCDLLIAGPDVLLLRDGERSSIVSFIEDICLMTFAYFFGTKTSGGASNDAN
jgi:hypothetical protein